MNEKEPNEKAEEGHFLKRLIKLASIAIASILVLIGVLILVAKYAISDRIWLAAISSAMEDGAGYTMEVKGDVSFDLSLHTTFKASDVVISNRMWTPEPVLGKFDQLAIGLDLLPLLSYQLILDLITKDSDIVLEYNEQGKSNWKLEEPSFLEAFEIETNQLNISDTKVIYRDRAQDLELLAQVKSLEFEPENRIYSSQLTLTGSYQDVDYLADGNLRVDPAEGSGIVSLKAGVQPRGLPIDLQDPDTPTMATVEGTVARDESGWRFDLDTEAKIQDPAAIISLVPQVPEAATILFPLQASAKLTLADNRIDVTKLVASVKNPTLSLRAEGDVNNVTDVPQIKLVVNSSVEDISMLPAYKEFDPASLPSIGPLLVSASLSGSGEDLEFNDINISVDQPGLNTAATGAVEFTSGNLVTNIDMNARIDDLSQLPGNEALVPGGLPALGPVTLSAHISSSGDVWNISDIQVGLEQTGLNAAATGAIEFTKGNLVTNIDLSARVDDLSELPGNKDFVPGGLPAVGPVALSAHMSSNGDNWDISGIQAGLEQTGLNLAINGAIRSTVEDPAIALEFEGRVDALSSLPSVGEFDPAKLPIDGALALNGQLSGIGDEVDLVITGGSFTRPGVHITATGKVSSLLAAPKVNLDLSGKVDQISTLPPVGGVDPSKLPLDGELSINTTLLGSAGTWNLTDLDARINTEELEASASGDVSYQLGGDPGADINFRVRGDALSALPDLGFIDRKKVHADGPFAASGKLIGSGNHWDLKDVWFTYHQPGSDGFITLTGNVDDLIADGPAIDITLQASASSLDKYSSLLGIDLPDRGVVEFRSRLTGKEDAYRLAISDSYMGNNDFSGVIAFNTAGKIPDIKASLQSRRINVGMLFYDEQRISRRKAGAIETEPAAAKSEPATSTPINLDWMISLDAELDLSSDHLILNEYSFYKNSVSLVLKGGNLKVSRGGGSMGGGTGEWNLEIAHDETPTRYYFKLDFEGVEFADLLALPPGVIRKGETSGTVLMASEGNTVEELLAHLNGGILLSMGPARIYDAGISLVSGNLLSGILRGVSTTDEEGLTGYECGIFGVVFQDGIATINKSITLQSKRFNITAKGTIDLPSRTIDLHMRPRSKKGFGYSVSSLVGGFQIKGDLASPKVKLNAGEITLTLLIGLLRGPIDRINSGKYSCDNVLAKIATGLEEIDRKHKIHSGVWRGLRDEIDK